MEEIKIKNLYGYDHITFWVGNAMQASSYYVSKLGFKKVAKREMEDGEKSYSTHVVRQNNSTICFSTALKTDDEEFANHMKLGGDSIKDLAFTVENCKYHFYSAVENGAIPLVEPYEMVDENGIVVLSKIKSPVGTITYTFVERAKYSGVFLPGFNTDIKPDPTNLIFSPTDLVYCDHNVYCLNRGQMPEIIDWHLKVMGFKIYWYPMNERIKTDLTELGTCTISDASSSVKFTLTQPLEGKSHIQEFLQFNGRQGIQHIALITRNIVKTMSSLIARGVDVLVPPKEYYKKLREKIENKEIVLNEEVDLDEMEKNCIFVGNDETKGNILQGFTKILQDKPTFFIEFIQKCDEGTGIGLANFNAIYQTIEFEQHKRGNI